MSVILKRAREVTVTNVTTAFPPFGPEGNCPTNDQNDPSLYENSIDTVSLRLFPVQVTV
jgi:hypothetical protein